MTLEPDDGNQFSDMVMEYLKEKQRQAKESGPEYIPFLCGRPCREKIISADEILNLVIELNVCKTVEDFIKAM